MDTLEGLKQITFLTSILGIVISIIFWLKIQRLLIYIPYTILTLLYILISVFEPNSSPPYVNYTDEFYLYEIITSWILIIGIFYQKSNINIKISLKNRLYRLLPLLILSSFLICINSTTFVSILVIIIIFIFLVLINNDYRVTIRKILKKIHFIEIILLIAFIFYFVADDLIGKIIFALYASNSSALVYEYRNAVSESIVMSFLKSFSLSLIPFFSIYYLSIFWEAKKYGNFCRAIIFVIIGGMVAFSTLGKARITYYIAGLVLSSSISNIELREKLTSKKLTFKNILNILMVVLIPLVFAFLSIQFMYFLTGLSRSQEDFTTKFIVRLIEVPVQANAGYFEIFPSTESFQLLGNSLTKFLSSILDIFGIDIGEEPIEAVASSRLAGRYFMLIASGFAMAYGRWGGLLSPLITALFVINTIQIDGILYCLHDKKVYSVYSYILTMMPVTVTVGYDSAVGLFGIWLVPLSFIFLYVVNEHRQHIPDK
jgi:hypothetical protein